MQTLDRRISASSDQLDTLKKQKNRQKPFRTRSSSRLSYERKFDTPETDFKFPSSYYQKPPQPKDAGSRSEVTKTPFEIFLEDDGPYSRKLYGPVTSKSSVLERSRERQSQNQKSFSPSKIVGGLNKLRKEKLVYTPVDNFREKVLLNILEIICHHLKGLTLQFEMLCEIRAEMIQKAGMDRC